jgi:hypothetical protein
MRMVVFSLALCALGFSVPGCGPLDRPMPVRLNDENQKEFDEAWNKALSPITKHDHQALLDLLVVTGAYQNGVDELYFRSTKRFQAGLVVMEIHYDRRMPNNDRFVVQMLDFDGKLLRQESYDRGEIDKTNEELLKEKGDLERKKGQAAATEAELAKLAELEARWATIEQTFPKADEKQGRQ